MLFFTYAKRKISTMFHQIDYNKVTDYQVKSLQQFNIFGIRYIVTSIMGGQILISSHGIYIWRQRLYKSIKYLSKASGHLVYILYKRYRATYKKF